VDRSAAGRIQDDEGLVEARILDAAAHLIAEDGFGRMKLGGVCAR
jgi:AcrR family transcriptional regulator